MFLKIRIRIEYSMECNTYTMKYLDNKKDPCAQYYLLSLPLKTLNGMNRGKYFFGKEHFLKNYWAKTAAEAIIMSV